MSISSDMSHRVLIKPHHRVEGYLRSILSGEISLYSLGETYLSMGTAIKYVRIWGGVMEKRMQ